MPSQNYPSIGASWKLCDLQLHTPFDRTRSFGEHAQDAARRADSGDLTGEKDIAFRWFEACSAAGLDLVAVTDHNDVDGYIRLHRHLPAWFDEGNTTPTLLPGIEITLGTERPIDMLLLTESDAADSLSELLAYVFSGRDRFSSADPRQPVSCRRGAVDLASCIREWFREHGFHYLLIPAHINSGSGLDRQTRTQWDRVEEEQVLTWELQLQGLVRQEAFAQTDWAGFQVTGNIDGLLPRLRDMLVLWAAAVQNGYLHLDAIPSNLREELNRRTHWPLLNTSDPQQYSDIGQRPTYLKMEDLSLEGVRLALLDPESRLRLPPANPPALDYPWICSIRITDTDFFDSFVADFNPNLNTLIGGRGTGKSMLLELLRYGLARETELTEDTGRRLSQLLTAKPERDYGETQGVLLPGHTVEIVVDVAGRLYKVVRDQDGITVTQDGDAEDFQLDVRALIGPRLLSQRQIADIAAHPSAQLRELDALGDVENQVRIEDQSSVEQELSEFQAERRRLQAQVVRIPAVRTELQQVRDRRAALEQEGSQQILSRYETARSQNRWVHKGREDLEDVYRKVRNLRDILDAFALTSPPSEEGEQVLGDLKENIQRSIDEARDQIDSAVGGLSNGLQEFDQLQAEVWQPHFESIETEYNELVEQLETQGTSFEEHESLLNRETELEDQLNELQALPTQLEEIVAAIHSKRNELDSWHRSRAAKRREVAQLLEEEDADIRIALDLYGDSTDLSERKEYWFPRAGLRDEDWDALVSYVYQGNSDQVPERLQTLVDSIRKDVPEGESDPGELSSLATWQLLESAQLRLSGHFRAFLAGLTSERLDEMERFLPGDSVQTKMRDGDGIFRSIEQGSLGQQSTAILSLLLAASGQPLVVDQPEDDLDNSYIYDTVVKVLRHRKFRRQVIISTHNANIPVNGDAENIVALEVAGGLGGIGAQGSIDRPAVKEAVGNIMEGSQEAFRLRRARYGF